MPLVVPSSVRLGSRHALNLLQLFSPLVLWSMDFIRI